MSDALFCEGEHRYTVGRSALPLVLLVLGGLGGCDVLSPLCDDDVAISIESGAAVRFSWAPDCQASQLSTLDSIGRELWVIDSESGFGPPVGYGDVPGGAREFIEPDSLRPGHRYRVVVGVRREGRTALFSEEFRR